MAIFFAWVDAGTAFNAATHARVDEDVFSFQIEHEEGQMPIANVLVKNPQKGLLNSTRKQWAWISTDKTGSVVPLFYGRLIGIPDDLFGYLVTLQFISRAPDYISQKWALADTLRVRPYYDPIFLSDEALIDPDVTLEGYSAAWHVSRTTLEWTVSDILQGEDGTVTFGPDKILEGSLSLSIKDSPLRALRVDAKVNWSQTFRGQVIPIYSGTVQTLTGDSLAQQWPKPYQSLGGGWAAGPNTFAVARGGSLGVYSESGSWQDQNQTHKEGDTISASWSASLPLSAGFSVNVVESRTFGSSAGGYNFLGTPGFGGEGSSGGGNPQSGYNRSWTQICGWAVTCGLTITPDGSSNAFTENLSLTLKASVQNLLSDPTAQEETEVITLTGQDVGEAVLNYKAWTTLAGTAVVRGQIIYPNIQVGFGASFQIVVTPGTLGTTPIAYSDTIGDVTLDGTAELACIGPNLPTISDWTPSTFFKVGQVICLAADDGIFFICDQEGFTGGSYPAWNKGTDAGTGDGDVTWISLGRGGPSFVVPIGGQPGNITQTAFFSQERGAAAVEYMLMRARARMRQRARAIEISVDVPFEDAINLSCRKNATIVSTLWNAKPLIPGGSATGKIIRYELSGDGESGEFVGRVTVGVSVGNGGAGYSSILGTPTYVQTGYVLPGYQYYDGAVASLVDVTYTPPPPDSTFNGFSFPLTYNQVVLFAGWMGSYATQVQLAAASFTKPSAASSAIGVSPAFTRSSGVSSSAKAAEEKLNSEAGSVFFQLSLRPISGQFKDTPYVVQCSDLIIPKGIDLSAP